MNIGTRSSIVVEGEASESDEESASPAVQSVNKLRQDAPAQQAPKRETLASVVVSGEASESDEDDSLQHQTHITPLRVDETGRGDSVQLESPLHSPTDSESISSIERGDPKYDTLLHRKLRETNAALRRSLCGSVGQVYVSSAKEIRNITQQLSKSQASIQDVSHNMRLLTNDLFHLEDKIDIIASCNLLPSINISISEDVHPTLGSSSS